MTTESTPGSRVSSADPPTIRAGDPSDVLGIIPYLVGFAPADDLVVVLLADRCVVVTARMDLDAVPDGRELAAQVEDLADLHGADAAVVVAYCAEHEPVAALFDGLPERLDGVRLVDLIHVDGQRWWSWLCRAGCCPPEGRPYDVASSRTAAAAVFAGLSALPSRASLAELVQSEPLTDQRVALFESVADELLPVGPDAAAEVVARVRGLCADQRLPDERTAAELAVSLFDVGVRDAVWSAQTRAEAVRAVPVWSRVSRLALPPFRVGPVCQLATAGWLSGDGALMSVCLETLESEGLENRLVAVLDNINRLGLPPSWWDDPSPGRAAC